MVQYIVTVCLKHDIFSIKYMCEAFYVHECTFLNILGSSSPGEIFNPGYDCSDILDKDTKAKDGFYWIQFNGYTPKKVNKYSYNEMTIVKNSLTIIVPYFHNSLFSLCITRYGVT